MYFYTVNLEMSILKNLYFGDKTFILETKTFKKNFIFENQS